MSLTPFLIHIVFCKVICVIGSDGYASLCIFPPSELLRLIISYMFSKSNTLSLVEFPQKLFHSRVLRGKNIRRSTLECDHAFIHKHDAV